MDGWQFSPAHELRRAFILDDTKLGPIAGTVPGNSAALVLNFSVRIARHAPPCWLRLYGSLKNLVYATFEGFSLPDGLVALP